MFAIVEKLESAGKEVKLLMGLQQKVLMNASLNPTDDNVQKFKEVDKKLKVATEKYAEYHCRVKLISTISFA